MSTYIYIYICIYVYIHIVYRHSRIIDIDGCIEGISCIILKSMYIQNPPCNTIATWPDGAVKTAPAPLPRGRPEAEPAVGSWLNSDCWLMVLNGG